MALFGQDPHEGEDCQKPRLSQAGDAPPEADCSMNVLWGSDGRQCIFRKAKLQDHGDLGATITMTWIRTVPLAEAGEKLLQAIEGEKAFYPKEYAEPVHPDPSGAASIVGSHTLIPDALFHAFATFGTLMSPELPLQRRQHEMIATMVSVTNRCVY